MYNIKLMIYWVSNVSNNQEVYLIIRQMARACDNYFTSYLRPLKIGPAGYLILKIIYENPMISRIVLSEKLNINIYTCRHELVPLIERKLVIVQRVSKHHVFNLTIAGQQLLHKAAAVINKCEKELVGIILKNENKSHLEDFIKISNKIMLGLT